MSNAEQIEYWNGQAGARWAAYDARMARLLADIGEALLGHAPPAPGARALDVGCGGGSQSQQLASELGEGGEVVGIDVSEPLLDVARRRARGSGASLSFVEADASTYPFEPHSFDLLFSRFGVMFFDDPTSAFANLRGALRPGASLSFSCWQSVKDNDWMWLPFQAALKHLPLPPPQPEHAPGPFAFADPAYVQSILGGAGFNEVSLTAYEATLSFDDGATLADNVRESASIGPISRMLEGVEAPMVDAVMAEIESVVEEFYDGSALNLPGKVWFVTAENPA